MKPRQTRRVTPDATGPIDLNGHEYDVITVGNEIHVLTPDGALIIENPTGDV